ncbi:MAG TPA: YciI family protein [Acidimicrobiales bacterium]|nr:YciI family protein [Acidimicrobiales bacterium]
MPQYLLSVHMVEGEPSPPEDVVQDMYAAVDRFNAKVQEAGVWVFAGGLHPADTATVVDNTKGGDPIVTDGPFSEAKEQIGGFWIVEVADLDDALKWATEASAACQGKVEVRPFQSE